MGEISRSRQGGWGGVKGVPDLKGGDGSLSTTVDPLYKHVLLIYLLWPALAAILFSGDRPMFFHCFL